MCGLYKLNDKKVGKVGKIKQKTDSNGLQIVFDLYVNENSTKTTIFNVSTECIIFCTVGKINIRCHVF